MRLPVRRHRRIMGRPASARFHRDAPAGGRFRAQRHAVLVGPAGRERKSQRRADALADPISAVAGESARFARAGSTDVGCRTVPGAEFATGSVDGGS